MLASVYLVYLNLMCNLFGWVSVNRLFSSKCLSQLPDICMGVLNANIMSVVICIGTVAAVYPSLKRESQFQSSCCCIES